MAYRRVSGDTHSCLCTWGSTGLIREKEGRRELAFGTHLAQRENWITSLGLVPFLTQGLSVPCSQTCWGSWVRDGRPCRHCLVPEAKAGLDLPSPGLLPKFPAAPMPTTSRSGPARVSDLVRAGGTCHLGSFISAGVSMSPVEMSHMSGELYYLGLSQNLHGQEGSPPLL